MNIGQAKTNNYSPNFGNVICGRGGKKVLKQIVRDGQADELLKIFKQEADNFAADICVRENEICVLDKLTGKEYLPSGRLLQKNEGNLAIFKEAELLDGSSKQVLPLKNSKGTHDYLYIGEKEVSKGGFFSKPETVKEYFKPQEESSYVIRQARKKFAGEEVFEPEHKLNLDEKSPIKGLVSKFNMALQIAYDIKLQAQQAIKENRSEDAIKAFVNHLVK